MSEPSSDFDPAALDRLVRFGGLKLRGAMVETFRSSGRQRVDAGRAAVAAGNAADAKLAYHSLKSSAAQLGAMRLSALCATAEALAGESRLDELAPIGAEIEGAYEEAVAWMQEGGATPEAAT